MTFIGRDAIEEVIPLDYSPPLPPPPPSGWKTILLPREPPGRGRVFVTGAEIAAAAAVPPGTFLHAVQEEMRRLVRLAQEENCREKYHDVFQRREG